MRYRNIVTMCFAVLLSLCVVSTAYSEDFSALLKKAERGDAEALFQVGLMYDEGRGVKQDHKKALDFYEVAAFCGVEQAKEAICKAYCKIYGK